MGLSLTVLGCSGSYPGPGAACSGYLVQGGGVNVVIDLGPGSLANLQRHIGLGDVDAVVLTHRHPDHWTDLTGLEVALAVRARARGPAPCTAPAETRELAEALTGGPGPDRGVARRGRRRRRLDVGGLQLRFARTDPLRRDAGRARRRASSRAGRWPTRPTPARAGRSRRSGRASTWPCARPPTWPTTKARGVAAPERPPGRCHGPGRRRATLGAHPPVARGRPGGRSGPRARGVRRPRRDRRHQREVRPVRPDGREPDELRPITFERDFTTQTDGSMLVTAGGTMVLCTASVDEGVPRWMKGSGQGLGHRRVLDAARAPRTSASAVRSPRAAPAGAPTRSSASSAVRCGPCATWCCSASARSSSTATCCRPTAAPARRRSTAPTSPCTTRSPGSCSGASSTEHPLREACAAVSVGIVGGVPLLDLPYVEDSTAEVDMNVVMTDVGPLHRGAGHGRGHGVQPRRARRAAGAGRARASARSSRCRPSWWPRRRHRGRRRRPARAEPT